MDRREAFEITHRVRALLDVAGELRLKSIKSMDQILKKLPAESKIYPNAEQFTDLQRLSIVQCLPFWECAIIKADACY